MESEFDKEIDILLRQAAQSGDLTTESLTTHLDADEINAFTEQLLSGKARTRAIKHLSDCTRCRNILSNIAVFNAEPESEIVRATEEKKVSASPNIPWYRKFFVFPQVAYAMGVLALLFGSIITFTILKSATQKNSSEVAQMEKNEAVPQSTVDGTTASNSAANVAGAYSANSPARTATANENISTAATPKIIGREALVNGNFAAPAGKNVEPAKPKSAPSVAENNADKKEANDILSAAPPMAVLRSENYDLNAAPAKPVEPPQTQAEESKKTAANKQNISQLPVNGRVTQSARMTKNRATASGAASTVMKDAAENAKTKNVGGKNFRRADGAWYDTNYKNQKTVNVTRNSEEYEKLDADIRTIANNLGGVVIIVSGSKAYRIQ